MQEQKLYDAEEFKDVISDADADNVRKKNFVDSVHTVTNMQWTHPICILSIKKTYYYYIRMDDKCIEIN